MVQPVHRAGLSRRHRQPLSVLGVRRAARFRRRRGTQPQHARGITQLDWKPIDAGGESGTLAPDPLHPGVDVRHAPTRTKTSTRIGNCDRSDGEVSRQRVAQHVDAADRRFTARSARRSTPATSRSSAAPTAAKLAHHQPRSHASTNDVPPTLDAARRKRQHRPSAPRRRVLDRAIAGSRNHESGPAPTTDSFGSRATRARIGRTLRRRALTPWSKVGDHRRVATSMQIPRMLRSIAIGWTTTIPTFTERTTAASTGPDRVRHSVGTNRSMSCAKIRSGAACCMREPSARSTFRSTTARTGSRCSRIFPQHRCATSFSRRTTSFWERTDAASGSSTTRAALREVAKASSAGTYLFAPAVAYRTRPGTDQGTPISPEETEMDNPPRRDQWITTSHPKAARCTLRSTMHRGTSCGNGRPRISRPIPNPKLLRYIPSLDSRVVSALVEVGAHRFMWDFHYAGAGGSRSRRGGGGPIAPPGRYTVRMTIGGKTYSQPLTVRRDPTVPATDADLRKQFELAQAIEAQSAQIKAALARATSLLKTHPQSARSSVKRRPPPPTIRSENRRRISEACAISATRYKRLRLQWKTPTPVRPPTCTPHSPYSEPKRQRRCGYCTRCTDFVTSASRSPFAFAKGGSTSSP